MKKTITLTLVFFLLTTSLTIGSITIQTHNTSFDGNTLYVGGSGPNNYTKIQDAINNASDGDTVFVYSGTYNEAVTVWDCIDLIGEDRHTTIIDGKDITGNVGVVFLQDGGDGLLSGFTIQNGGSEGGVVVWTNNNIITNNIITSCLDGIRCYGDYNILSENLIKDNSKHGINLYNSHYANVISNTFESDDCIYITYSWGDFYLIWGSHTMQGNTVNGKPIYYYGWESDIVVPEDAGQVILGCCDNCVIQNLDISNLEAGILIGGESYNIHIRNNSITQCNYGIEISSDSIENHISGNTIIDNIRGVYICDSSFNDIYENYFENNNNAVFIEPSLIPSKGNGKYFQGGAENDIYLNEFINNDYGVYLSHGWRNNIFENNIVDGKVGVYFEGSHDIGGENTLYKNNIINNEKGLQIIGMSGGGEDNVIYENNFYGNTEYNVYCQIESIWDHENIGNYWDDYEGFDNDDDGFGDTPYAIGEGSSDNYPIMTAIGITSNPPDKPIIDGVLEGRVRILYTYYGTTNDPDLDEVRYCFDWGDGSYTWTGYYSSGETGEAEHKWLVQGTYSVRVKARDRYGFESEWSDPLEVVMPKDKSDIYFDEYYFEDVNVLIYGRCRTIFSDGTWTGGLYIGYQSTSDVAVSDATFEKLSVKIYNKSISNPEFTCSKITKMVVSMLNVEGVFFWSAWKHFGVRKIPPVVFVNCYAKQIWIRK